MPIKKELDKILSKSKSAPILFIGSGLSRRYINTEDWINLLKVFCEDLQFGFSKYYGEANGNLPRVASLIAEEFYEVWWRLEKYKDSREKYGEVVTDKSSPLKIEICEYLKNKTVNNEYINEIALLKLINENESIDSIITTNYDSFLEDEIFNEYDVKIGQDDLLVSDTVGLEEIYKIHGSVNKPHSLVLNTKDYEEFNSKNAYLSAKLLTLFIEHPIIFLGYSMSDENIQSILKSIAKCMPKNLYDKISNNLIFIQPIFDNSEDKIYRDSITIDNISIPRTIIEVKDYSIVYNSILSYRRKFSAKLMKKMRKNLYEIIIENNPRNQIIASDFDGTNNIEGADYVIGVGLKKKMEDAGIISFTHKSLHGINQDDLLKDIVLNNIVTLDDKYKAETILKEVIKNKTKETFNLRFPIFKYLNIIDFSCKDIQICIDKILEKHYEDIFSCSSDIYKKREKKANKFSDSTSIISCKEIDLEDKIVHLIHLSLNKFDNIEALELFLKDNLDIFESKACNLSNFRRLVRKYDYLKYKN